MHKTSIAEQMVSVLAIAHSMVFLEMVSTGVPAQKNTIASKTGNAEGVFKRGMKVIID